MYSLPDLGRRDALKLKQVLIIDDSDADLLFTRLILEGEGVAEDVLCFETAPQALEYLQRPQGHHADIILLDINMPEMNGFAFLDVYDKLHAAQQARALVVMLTSSPDPTDRARADSYQCVKGYVVKPIDVPSAQALPALLGGLKPQD